ncbi:hypothetical protein ACHAWF_007928 [Thalassiosira exigua]
MTLPSRSRGGLRRPPAPAARASLALARSRSGRAILPRPSLLPPSSSGRGTASATFVRRLGSSPSDAGVASNSSWSPRSIDGWNSNAAGRGGLLALGRSPLVASFGRRRGVDRWTAIRAASGSGSNQQKSSEKSGTATEEAAGGGGEDPTSNEIVLTPGEKVVATTRLAAWLSAFAVASVCFYYIAKELLPTKLSPNAVFDKASAKIRAHPEVRRRFGESVKTYGRDHGGHREGRRNFVEHTEYTDPDDGSKRTRVRFNLEGQYGTAFVFAEVSSDMPSGEFVYVMVQDKRNGQVVTVEDNRSALLAKRLAGGNAEGQSVFSNLLGGGGGKKE